MVSTLNAQMGTTLVNTLAIIPAFNEENTIRPLVTTIEDLYPDLDIAVINDGSTDRTSFEVLKTKATLIEHRINLGYGTSIQTGYMYGFRKGYEYLIQLDGDGQHEPSDIGKLLTAVMVGKEEIIFGSRFLSNTTYKPTFFRLLGIRLFRLLILVLCGRRISDPTTGYQAMNRRIMGLFCSNYFPIDYPDADVIILLSMAKIKFSEIPVRMYEKEGGKSMHSGFFHSIYYVFKLIMSMLLTRFRRFHW